MDAPALGVEERFATSWSPRSRMPATRGQRRTRRSWSNVRPKRSQVHRAVSICGSLEEAESCTQPGEVGRLLRREGLYSSHLTEWSQGAASQGSLARQ